MGRRGSAIEKSVAYEQFGLSEKQVSEKVGTVTWPMSREQGHLDDCGDPNEGSDIYIAWETNAWTDPIGKTGIPSLFQEGGLSPINKVLIGHETFHALRLSLGIEIGLREGYHRSFSEFAAVVVENFIRESEGLPTRNSYGGVPFEENAQLNLIVLLQSIGLNVPKKETKKKE